MLEELNWMEEGTKVRARQKVHNMVRNIGFPDWITDDVKLNAYIKDYPIRPKDNLIETMFSISKFIFGKKLEPLAWDTIDRTEFGRTPFNVRARYQPQLNSITVPLALLSPPFFDPKAPLALNYGMIGAIVANELSHAFDDIGAQFDAFGQLRQWMDFGSVSASAATAQCVADQYGQFCPLFGQNYSPSCLDGNWTIVENVADNSAIRAAFQAFKNALNYRGGDKALPDPLIGQYNADQLFFLSFAQNWCQIPDKNPANIHQKLLIDFNPPPKYRLMGTLQNFAAFQSSFNCPRASVYAPEKHCDVWVSDVKIVIGEPVPPPILPPLNIPIRERDQSAKFREAAAYFERSVDTARDPCNQFYEYSCNAFDDLPYFDANSIRNLLELVKELRRDSHEQQIEPIEKAKLAFRKCTQMMGSPSEFDKVLRDADVPREKFNLFQKLTRLDFPIFLGQNLSDWPSIDEMSKTLGVLGGTMMIDSLISFFVDTNWKDPNSETMPYALFIDQPVLAFAPKNYHPDVFPHVYDRIESYVEDALVTMADYLGIEYQWNVLDNAVQEIVDFERTLANHFLIDEDTRQHELESRYNLFSVHRAQQQFGFLNWTLLLRELGENAPPSVKREMQRDDFRFVIIEPKVFAQLGAQLGPGNSFNFTANQLVNYMFFRLVLDNVHYVPYNFAEVTKKNEQNDLPNWKHWLKKSSKYEQTATKMPILDDQMDRLIRPPVGKPKKMPKFEADKLRKLVNNDRITSTEFRCGQHAMSMMDMVSGRLWLDRALPGEESRQKLIVGAEKVMNSILLSFHSMIQQISWMSPQAKASAYEKLDRMKVNIGWPDVMVNNTKLKQYYAEFGFTEQENFLQIWEQGKRFMYTRQWHLLAKRHGTDRSEFNGPIIFVNAWYQPQLNSITVPASILFQPFLDIEWPDSVKYGQIGVVLGHELSHAFDNHGVQWDSDGAMDKWLDPGSQKAFNRMAECVIDEYAGLCPFPEEGGIQPACIDGARTQGENIADNGGIHAAFRAYRAAIEVEGPTKALPGDLFGQFSHDQLFFLSFAQPWCEVPSELETWFQLSRDVHSPAKYRVLGSIRNFPAFREAFNCPLGSAYAPKEHCSVWVSPVSEKPLSPLSLASAAKVN